MAPSEIARPRRRKRSSASPFCPAASTVADDPGAVSDDRCDRRRIERMHLRTGQRQLGGCLAQRQFLIADLDAGVLQAVQQCFRVPAARLQLFELPVHRVGGHPALVVRAAVARGADRRSGRPQHRVRRLQHGVVAVALHAAFVEDLRVHAGLELGGEHGVAGAADVGHGADPGRRRAVVAVTVVARRRREVVAPGERGIVDALLIVGELRGWQRFAVRQRVAGHMTRIGVAGRAGRGDVGGEDRRLRVAHRPNPVRSVAAGASGDVGVARRELLAVHAGGVLGRLIHALFRREAPHQRGVAVAARAGRDLRLPDRRALESSRARRAREPCRCCLDRRRDSRRMRSRAHDGRPAPRTVWPAPPASRR